MGDSWGFIVQLPDIARHPMIEIWRVDSQTGHHLASREDITAPRGALKPSIWFLYLYLLFLEVLSGNLI